MPEATITRSILSRLFAHGGWLDRIDSMLFAVPVIYALVWLVRNF